MGVLTQNITRLLELKDVRISILEEALQEGLEMWLETHEECNWTEHARIVLKCKGDY